MMTCRALVAPFAVSIAGCFPSDQPPSTPNAEAKTVMTFEPPPPGEEPPPPDAGAPEGTPVEAQPIDPGITRTNTPTRGTLPPAVVEERLNAANPAIKACYERALKAKPDLVGNLSIDFVVDVDGKVAHAQAGEVEEPLKDGPTVECILGEIRKLEFPKPDGGRVFLNYPMRLEAPKPEP